MHLKFPTLRGTWYTDTMFTQHKSIRSCTCAQVFTNGFGFDRVYPIGAKNEAHLALTKFIQDVGIPQTLTMDNAPEQIYGQMKDVINAHHIKVEPTLPKAPWKNKAEASIREKRY